MRGVPKELTPLRIALLVLYAKAFTKRQGLVVPGANAYEIELLIRSRLGGVRGYGKSAVYDNSKQLAALGYLAEVVIGDSTRAVTAHVVTQKGADAISEWMKTPTEPPHLDTEIFLRARAVDPRLERFVADTPEFGVSGPSTGATSRVAIGPLPRGRAGKRVVTGGASERRSRASAGRPSYGCGGGGECCAALLMPRLGDTGAVFGRRWTQHERSGQAWGSAADSPWRFQGCQWGGTGRGGGGDSGRVSDRSLPVHE